MKTKFLIGLLILLLLPIYAYGKIINVQVNSSARVTKLVGTLNLVEGKSWHLLSKNAIIKVNQRIKTAKNSKAELTFSDGKIVRLSENTDVTLIKSKKEEHSIIKILTGKLWSNIKNVGSGRFAVQGPTAVLAVMGTTFEVEAEPKQTDLSVFEGSVGVQQPNEKVEELNKNLERLKLEVDDNKNKESAKYEKPKEVAKPYTEIERPVKVISVPHEVSKEEWLEIVANQKISINDQGVGVVSNLESDKLKNDEWVKWNIELDSNTSEK